MPTILIVDDSATQLQRLHWVLEQASFSVLAANNAATALQIFEDHYEIDLVITDIVMPEQSGYDLCRCIKASARPTTPVILLSSLSDPMDIIQGLECGADNFITKPFEADQLLGRVQSVIENRALRRDGPADAPIEIAFLGKRFTVTSGKGQILSLLIGIFEDIVHTNRGLQESRAEIAEAKAQIESYAYQLEQRVAERTASLTETNQTLRALIHSSPLAIISLDRQRRIRDWNQPAEEIFGEAEDAAFGQPFKPDILREGSDFDGLIQRSMAGEVIRDVPLQVRHRDGRVLDVELSAAPLFDSAGTPNGVVQMLRDVTRRKALEMQLHHAQKLETVGQLTGGIAHDFNNMLAVIIGHLELLEEEAPDRPDLLELTGVALDAALRGATLTRQLLTFSRRQPLESRAIDLNEIVRSTAVLLSRTLGEAIDVRLRLQADLWAGFADAGQLESVVTNLAVNARDAMPEGGTLTLATSNVHVDRDEAEGRSDMTPGDYVLLAVIDTGTGMAPDVLDKVLEPFFTTKDVGKGTGLGLSMAYGFARQSGGHIELESRVGGGTTVRLYLPRDDGRRNAFGGAISAGEAPRGTEKILLVEDNDGVRSTLTRQLSDLGYSVLQAEDALTALAVLHHTADVDLLLTDVVMAGGLSGLDLAQRVRQASPALRILFTSGFIDADSEAKIRHDYGDRILKKPFRKQDLAAMVRMALADD